MEDENFKVFEKDLHKTVAVPANRGIYKGNKCNKVSIELSHKITVGVYQTIRNLAEQYCGISVIFTI